MQMQASSHQPDLFHAHPSNHIHTNGGIPNGIHSESDTKLRASAYTNGVTNGDVPNGLDMQPYQRHPSGQQYYPGAYQAQQGTYQQHQQQQQPSQHPPPPQYHQQPQQSWQQDPRNYGPPPPILPPLGSNMGGPTLPPPGQIPTSMPGPPGPFAPQTSHYGGAPPQQMSQQLPPPPGSRAPAQQVELTKSGNNGKYKFTLKVEQQPARARMCGFGDKDRRPITPPPCIRLIIEDLQTGKPVDMNDIDGSFFILQVDLWSEDGQREVNIVRASSSSPAVSISTATTTSYPPTHDRPSIGLGMMYTGYPVYAGQTWPQTPSGMPLGHMPQSNNTMFTRNLIGSLTVNAARLTDLEGSAGYWFVLQDLSVRTEGWFRLKMNFIDVGSAGSLNRGRAPVLAHVFSEKFQVFSAKKFPGVIESTPLSKQFAQQGIKIPIRKDGRAEGAEKEEEDD